MRRLELTRNELCEKLSSMRNEFDEVEIDALRTATEDEYLVGADEVFVLTKNELVVIPMSYTNDNENYYAYAIVHPEGAYTATEDLDRFSKTKNNYTAISNLLNNEVRKETVDESEKTIVSNYVIYRMPPSVDIPEVLDKETLAVFPVVNLGEFPEIQLGDIVEIDIFESEQDPTEYHCKIIKVLTHGEVIDESIFE